MLANSKSKGSAGTGPRRITPRNVRKGERDAREAASAAHGGRHRPDHPEPPPRAQRPKHRAVRHAGGCHPGCQAFHQDEVRPSLNPFSRPGVGL